MAIKNEEFVYNGRTLEIRSQITIREIIVRVFEKDHPATNIIYTVKLETIVDAAVASLSVDLVSSLVKIARDDIEAGRVQLLKQR